MHLTLPDGREFPLDDPAGPRIVGVLNITPDSFSDGGQHPTADAAVLHAHQLIDEGAAIIDVGGESTRPGAARISADEQIARIAPVIEQLAAQTHTPISIDTTRSAVAAAALDAGASIINDITAGRDDPAILTLAAARRCPIILMHSIGEPATMQDDPHYDDVAAEVLAHLLDRAAAARQAGVPRHNIVIDPGIGFGKTDEHNMTLMTALDRFVATGYAVMLGASRKGFLGRLTGRREPADRVAATCATTVWATAAGVQLIRVHDVACNRDAAIVTSALARHRNA